MIICFPSPCGVLVLKFYLIFLNHFIDKLGFRPLAGFWFLNLVEKICIPLVVLLFRPLAGFWFLNYKIREAIEVDKSIPSPCGVLVLKLARNVGTGCESCDSVPLRGSGS